MSLNKMMFTWAQRKDDMYCSVAEWRFNKYTRDDEFEFRPLTEGLGWLKNLIYYYSVIAVMV